MASSIRQISTRLLLLVSLLALTASCGKANEVEPAGPKAPAFDDLEGRIKIRDENPVSETMLRGMNQFALATASQVLSAEKGNTLYSPYSLYIALALAASGADGATKEEMTALLGAEQTGNKPALAGDEVGNLIRLLHTDNKIGRLKTANSVWIQKGHAFRKEYGELAAGSFYASLHQADFGDKETVDRMSEWVREHTGGQISPELKPDPTQVMALMNTLDFKDEWTDPFNENQTAPGTFYLDEGPMAASFMSRTLFTTTYTKGEGYASAALGLKNGGTMTFVLPDQGVAVKELVASPEKARALLQGSDQPMRKLTLKVPKFDYSTEMSLNQPLQALGMRTAFTNRADFGGISDTPIFISKISQNAHIAIDEKGVEAAAFTQIMMVGSAMPNGEPVELVLDRPFLYSIVAPNGTILFTGICRQP